MLTKEQRDWLRWLAADLYKSDEVQLGERSADLGDFFSKHAPAMLDALDEAERERESFERLHAEQGRTINALARERDEARREVAVSDQLLAIRNGFLADVAALVGGCEAHGDDCQPHLLEKLRKLIPPR